MPIYKRGKTFWIDISAPDGSRVRQSAKTQEKVKAQQLHDKIKHELWAVSKLDKKPERLFEELMIITLREAEGQSCFENKQIYARYFLNVFGGRVVSSITGEEIADSLPTHSKGKRPLANATRNRYRAFIMRAFSLAHKHGWIDRTLHAPLYREPKVRVRWIEKHQARSLIGNLTSEWMIAVCSFALLTGARMGEILSLRRESIDLRRKAAIVTAENAKSGRARRLPLNDEALGIVRSIEKKGDYPFSPDGVRASDIDRKEFARALALSGIEDFRFHDLRHTWASWHVQNGTPLMMLRELGGWEKLDMVMKYAHLSSEHLSQFSGIVTFLAQPESGEGGERKISLVS